MKEVYLWTVEYSVSGSYVYDSIREIRVVTKTDKYGEAESKAIKSIQKILEDSRLDFSHITNIKPSQVAYADIFNEEEN